MPTIKVNTTQLRNLESEMQDVLSRINSIKAQFNATSRNLDWDIRAESNINFRINSISRDLAAECVGLREMKTYIGIARKQYNIVGKQNNCGEKLPKKKEKSPLFGEIASDALFSASVTIGGTIIGTNFKLSQEQNVLGYDIKSSSKASFDTKKGELGAEVKINADAYLAKNEATRSLGLLNAKNSYKLGNVGASGKIGATLFKNGKLAPSIGAELKAEASVAEVKSETRIGTENVNIHTKAEATLLGAEAKAGVAAGKIQYEDSSGNTITSYGVTADVGAEAYLAKGKISGGFTLCGIKFDAELEGKAGGVGIKGGGHISEGSASGEIGLGLGLGAGLKFNVDWSGFKV